MDDKLKAKLLAYPAATIISLVGMTQRHQTLRRDAFPPARDRKRTYIFAFWHSRILLPLYIYRHNQFGVLISQSRDGEYITQTVRRLGYWVARGSSSRRGGVGLRELQDYLLAGNSVIITPDGPRGPREIVQMGVIQLAKSTGVPIIPIAFSCTRHRRLNSWDRFMVPLPFGKVITVMGDDIFIPADTNARALEAYRQRVERGIREITRLADEATGTEILPDPETDPNPSNNCR